MRQIDYIIEDVKEVRGEVNGIDYNLIREGLQRYFFGEFNVDVHEFVRNYKHIFVAFGDFHDLIMQNYRSFENNKEYKWGQY